MDPIEHLKDTRHIRFESGVKERIRAELLAHMEAHPLPLSSPYHAAAIRSPFTALLRKPAMVLVLVLLVGVGGATTFAAAGSALPGSPLYPVKVSIIEPARVLLAATPEDKAAVNVSIALTRVHEAEQLAVKDKLTSADSAEIQKGFEHSLGNAKATLVELAKQSPDAAASLEASLAVSLDAHEDVLATLSNVATTSAAETRTLAVYVKERARGNEDDEGASVEAHKSAPPEPGPTRAAVMLMAARAPELAATTSSTTVSSTTVSENDTEDNGHSEAHARAVEKEKDSILRSLGL